MTIPAPTEATLLALLEKATPGPWRVSHHDDSYCMSAVSIRTDAMDYDLDEVGDHGKQHGGCVAMTLLQEPRYICHDAKRWHEDAALIVAAVNALPALLGERARLRAYAECEEAWQNAHDSYDAAVPTLERHGYVERKGEGDPPLVHQAEGFLRALRKHALHGDGAGSAGGGDA